MTLIEQSPIGVNYHDSFAKHSFNAAISQLMDRPAALFSALALQAVMPYGYSVVKQKRQGYKDQVIEITHIQSMDQPDLPITCDKEAHTPLLVSKVHRNLAVDSLLEFSQVSKDPYRPGALAAVGPRPQSTEQVEIIKDMCKPTIADRELCSKWLDIKPQVYPGAWSTASTVSDHYRTGTLDFHRTCMKADINYFEHANLGLDFSVFAAVMMAANKRIKQVPLPNKGLPPCCGKLEPVTYLISRLFPQLYSPGS